MQKNTSSFQRFALTFAAAAGCLAMIAVIAIAGTHPAITDAAPGGAEWVKNVPVFGLKLSFT